MVCQLNFDIIRAPMHLPVRYCRGRMYIQQNTLTRCLRMIKIKQLTNYTPNIGMSGTDLPFDSEMASVIGWRSASGWQSATG